MHYALTINADQIITGVHESGTPITTNMFSANAELSEDTVVSIPSPADYQTYTHILCYDEDGALKDLVWCIENGYMELPPNKEIINGELVDKEIPAEEQPQTIKQYLKEQFGMVRQEAEMKIVAMKPLMTELVKGKPANIVISTKEFILDWVADSYEVGDVRRDANGYPKRCITLHNSITSPAHTIDVASLWAPYHGTTPETALPWIAPTGAQDMYKVGEYMIFTDEKIYKCVMDTNFSPTDDAQAWIIDGEEPVIPEEPEEPEVTYNSNGTVAGSTWVPWNSYPATLYQIGDTVTHNGILYIATTGNNYWEPGVSGWNVVPV